ncbi:MAG: S-layer homology domain-containing protein [Bacillota bacterium]|nr:S-layer homology domain-containing protein [Bacillota bacterium]
MRFATMRRWRPGRMMGMFLVLVLAVSVLLGTIPGPVLADDDEDQVRAGGSVTVAGRHGLPPGLAKKLAKWSFDDEDEASWGHEYMAKMRAKELIKGVGGNRFAPGAKLTYAEAATMAVRLMGLETQAQERTTAQLRFANAAQLQHQYPWALGYLDVAARNGLLDRLVENGRFQANKPATRLDVVVLLVKAMGLEDEALAGADAQLGFHDLSAIPADLIGYVAVACKYEIVKGYDDRTFKPNKPVTRLEMAALLDRADWWLPPRSPYQVEGKLVAASEANSTVTLEVYQRWWPHIRPALEGSAAVSGQAGAGAEATAAGVTASGQFTIEVDAQGNVRVVPPIDGPVVTRQEYEVSEDALILLDGKPAGLGDLPAGAWTRLVLNTEKVAVVVDARSTVRVPPPPPAVTELEGTVTALDTVQKTITVRTEEQNQVTVRLADQVRVRYRGEDVALGEVKVGDQVNLRLENHVVVRIIIQEREEEEELQEFAGAITAITKAADGTVTLTVYGDDDETLVARVAANAVITYEGEPLPVEDLQVGDRVELKLQDGVIVEIKVEERPEATLTARLKAITVAENRWVITLEDAAGNTFTYQLSSRVQIRLHGQVVGVTALRVGDQVQVRVAGGLVYRIEILR